MIFFASLWDTGADAEIRKSIYSRADAVMICFSVDHDEETIREVLNEFVKESMNVSKNIFLGISEVLVAYLWHRFSISFDFFTIFGNKI